MEALSDQVDTIMILYALYTTDTTVISNTKCGLKIPSASYIPNFSESTFASLHLRFCGIQ